MRFVFLLSLALAAGAAQADVRARVVATDPPTEATLGRDQAFYVRIQFDADEPVGFWTRAYSRGKKLSGWKSNASAKWSGSGHALGWISFAQPVEVDEIRIVAGGGKPYVEREVATYPVKLRWREGPAAGATAPWVAELKLANAAAWEAERRAAAARPASTWETALGLLISPLLVTLVLACVGAPLWALWKWRGGWRLAATLPVAVIVFVVGRIVIDTARDPKSHNLWPLEIVLYGAAGLAFIVALALVRRFVGADASRS